LSIIKQIYKFVHKKKVATRHILHVDKSPLSFISYTP
jgi:hypothetical protein